MAVNNKKDELLDILQNLDQQLTHTQEDQQLARLQEILKSDEVDINGIVPTDDYVSFLCWAIQNTTNEKIIEHLIMNGADVNNCAEYGSIPLIEAICVNSLTKVKMLVSHGANVNQVPFNFQNNTPLTYAASHNQISIVEYLLQHGADPNMIGWCSKTPLTWAISQGNVQIVQLLIDNGAIINKADDNGETPIILAKQKGNQEILQMLNVADDNIEANTLKLGTIKLSSPVVNPP